MLVVKIWNMPLNRLNIASGMKVCIKWLFYSICQNICGQIKLYILLPPLHFANINNECLLIFQLTDTKWLFILPWKTWVIWSENLHINKDLIVYMIRLLQNDKNIWPCHCSINNEMFVYIKHLPWNTCFIWSENLHINKNLHEQLLYVKIIWLEYLYHINIDMLVYMADLLSYKRSVSFVYSTYTLEQMTRLMKNYKNCLFI